MKGLLLKDLFVIWKQGRIMLVLVLFYIVLGAVNSENSFLSSFAVLFASLISITVMGLDERSRWDSYAVMLPCSRKEIVLSKYIIGIGGAGTTLLLHAVFSSVIYFINGNGAEWATHVKLFIPMAVIPCIFLGISLPIMFKMGVEKGRLWLMLTAVLAIVVGISAVKLFGGTKGEGLFTTIGLEYGMVEIVPAGLLLAAGIAVLVFSALLSIRIFEKREL